MTIHEELEALSEKAKIEIILALRARVAELESSAVVQQSANTHTSDSQAELLSVLEHLPVMFDAVNANRDIVFWNHQCELITGYSKSEILNNPGWVQLLYPDPEYVAHIRQQRLLKGENYRQETQIRCKDGSVRTIAWLSEAGEMPLLGWESWAVGIDVTERKAYEQALRNVERRYSALVNQSQNAVFFGRLDNPEYIVELNEAAARMLGYDPSQTTRLHISQVVPPDQDEAREAMLDRLLRGEDLPVYERIVQRRDGTRFPIEINAIVIRDETGKPSQVMSICRDISERKAMEARLRISESWFRAVFNSRVLMVIVLDAFGSMVKVNPALAESLGYTREAMQHTPFERYVHPDDLAEAMETFAAIRQGERDSGQATIRALHKNGQIVWLDLVGVVQRDEDGEFQSIVIVGKDITLERDTEQIVFHLAVERERLRVIAEFIEAASHEFRTPLSRINTNLYLLRKQLGKDNVAPYVDRIEDESNNLLQLIEGLFKMVHLSSDHRYTFEQVDVNQLVAIAVGRVNARVEATGLKLTQDLDETLPLVFLEPDLIAETLVQVLDNAIRYTPNDGTIRIMTRQGEDSVVITVTDSGIGMEPQVLPHVFNQFYREDTARSTPGLGLGLSIAKKIVEHHRGQINITSEQGRGTIVTIQLSLPESPTV